MWSNHRRNGRLMCNICCRLKKRFLQYQFEFLCSLVSLGKKKKKTGHKNSPLCQQPQKTNHQERSSKRFPEPPALLPNEKKGREERVRPGWFAVVALPWSSWLAKVIKLVDLLCHKLLKPVVAHNLGIVSELHMFVMPIPWTPTTWRIQVWS